MLYRKIESLIEEHLKSDSKKILLIDVFRRGALQILPRGIPNTLLISLIQA